VLGIFGDDDDDDDDDNNVMQTINEWLPAAEKQLNDFSPIATEQRAVRIQIEQLKVLSIYLL